MKPLLREAPRDGKNSLDAAGDLDGLLRVAILGLVAHALEGNFHEFLGTNCRADRDSKGNEDDSVDLEVTGLETVKELRMNLGLNIALSDVIGRLDCKRVGLTVGNGDGGRSTRDFVSEQ